MAVMKTKTLAGNAQPGFHKKSHGITAVPHVMPNGDIVRALIMPRPRANNREANPAKTEAAQAKRNRKKQQRRNRMSDVNDTSGEIISHSEQYASKWNAKRAAKKLSKLTGFPLEDHTH